MSVDRFICPRCGAQLERVHTLAEVPTVPDCDNCARLDRRRQAGVCLICPSDHALGCDLCAKHCRAVAHPRCQRAAKRDYMRLYMRGYSSRRRSDQPSERGAA